MNKHYLDMETYPRKDHFDYFRSLANPYVGVTVDVDVTDLVAFCKKNSISFYLTFIHAAGLAANEIPELRQRICEGGIVEYDECATSHTESAGDGTYCYCELYHRMPFEDYLPYAVQKQKESRIRNSFKEESEVASLLFITSLPWLHYRDFTQPTACGDESNPRISWGKYEEDFRGRLMMPVTLLCNHALVDGIHLAAFYDHLNHQISVLSKKGN